MSVSEKPEIIATEFPDHTQLPDSDGTFVKNFQEHPQSILLTTSIRPILEQVHPDGQYCIGQDSGIYWRVPSPRNPQKEQPKHLIGFTCPTCRQLLTEIFADPM